MKTILWLTVGAGLLLGQAQTPTHRHYERDDRAAQASPTGALAPRLQNLGVHTFPVSTASEQAQRFINQGVNLAYGFNHAEAARAFAEAARLDPNLAMAYWGHALVLGPNINAPMDPADEPRALELVQRAVALKSGASERERAYIDALATRYTGKPEDRAASDRAFADAMRAVADRFPDDVDARTIYAEALMDLRPWNYWTRDGKPYEETVEVIRALETAIAANRQHPGALHYWVHLWEPTDTPERAEAEADRLLPLMPGAGHMVHMPAHIFHRVGRHQDVVTSNQLAEAADEDYITQCRAQGMYPLAYYPHNTHFIWMGASASGQSAIALAAASKVEKHVLDHAASLEAAPFLQPFLVVPYWTQVTFERWDDVLAGSGPTHRTPFTEAAWRYARGRALAAKGRVDEAEAEHARLRGLIDAAAFKTDTAFSANGGYHIMRIGADVLAGEIAAARKDYDRALLHLERAVRFEDGLIYQEPSEWPHPVRLVLGRVLLDAGRAEEAEVVYWEDLKRNPETGWALHGLARALRAQGKTDEAARIDARFKKAWSRADFTLPG